MHTNCIVQDTSELFSTGNCHSIPGFSQQHIILPYFSLTPLTYLYKNCIKKYRQYIINTYSGEDWASGHPTTQDLNGAFSWQGSAGGLMDFTGTNSLTRHCSTSQVRCSTHLAVQHPPANSHKDRICLSFIQKA